MARLGAWAALAFLTLYLVFFGGGWQGIYTSALRSISTVGIGIALGIWFVLAWRRPEWRPKSAFLPAIAACLASMAITTWTSRFPRLGVEYLAVGIALAALYLLLVRILARPWFRARMATLATAIAVVIGGQYVVLTALHWVDWWVTVGRITVPPLRPDFESLTFGNPAAVMTMSVLLTAFGGASLGVATQGRALATTVLVLLAGATTLFSGSRAGWLAVAAAFLVTLIAWLASSTGRAQARTLARRMVSTTAGRIAAVVVVGGTAVATVILGPAILLRTGAGGEDLRVGYLTAAIRMFQESPVVGTGPGTWVAQRILYTDPPTTDYYIPHAHNVYVQTLSEQGVIGAIAGIVVIVSILALIRRAARDPIQQRWVLAAIFATGYFAAHQLFDFYMNFPSVMFAAALPIAWLDATNEPPRPSTLPAPAWLPSALAVIAAVGFMWSVEGPAGRHSEAVGLANDGKWAAALEPAEGAAREDPDIPAYQVTYGLTLARAGRHEDAIAAFRRAVAVDGFPETWLNIAAEEHVLGHEADAIEAWDKAMRLGYERPAVAFAAGVLALELQDENRAIDAFASAIAITPSLAGDPWWEAAPDRLAVYERAVNSAFEHALAGLDWEIALMARQPDHAALLTLDPDVDGAFARTVIEAWSNTPAMTDDEARQSINRRCGEQPLNATPLGWCARLSARAGEEDEANRYRKWAFTLGADAALSAELRVSPVEIVGRSAQGGLAEFYGTYTYRRPTPWDLLVPSLAHLTFQ